MFIYLFLQKEIDVGYVKWLLRLYKYKIHWTHEMLWATAHKSH